MIVGTMNIRGGGRRIKRRRVSHIIKRGMTDIFLIQETKLPLVSYSVAKSFWGSEGFDFSFSSSEGMSGGLLIIWKSFGMEVLCSFKGMGFLGIKVRRHNSIYYIVNVYSPCSLVLKRELWGNLLRLKSSHSNGDWLIGGDFNAMKDREERVGRMISSNNIENREFSKFIDESMLVDVPLKWKKFSWFVGNGKAKSRIDRFLVADNIIQDWGVVGQFIGNRDISDHCPIWLVLDRDNWGPKPFKCNNEWFSNKEFIPFVEKEWKAIQVYGRGDFILKEKFRIIKDRLR
ncbi:uncharacterized protein LOC131628395 [Vicia villosa]|uniref:uncharacterized protein LOC131628395 n=1 Tax=Vicia villosa TaxID=3911 RepID=UPI00273BFC3F|nr:uncharacterized protein LOC131628395 [Vicia villosa]